MPHHDREVQYGYEPWKLLGAHVHKTIYGPLIDTASYAELGTRSFFPGSLSAHFLSMDRFRSIAHFADFQVCSSLNRSKKTSGSLLLKSAKKLNHSQKNSGSLSLTV